MNLRELIEKKYIIAIKSKNVDEVNTLRLIKSAIKDKDIENRSRESSEGIDDPKILSLLQSLVKQRKDSIESFELAKRDDLVDKEKIELGIINNFLPKQHSIEETENIIKNVIKNENLSALKDMGLLMKLLKKDYSGSMDMAMAGKIAKNLLNK
jgi:uncharacterized protein YqeY|tara:strand:- start:613 stop:1074 length:462 start_codon:yes stop_codon:yes gene_type:complete